MRETALLLSGDNATGPANEKGCDEVTTARSIGTGKVKKARVNERSSVMVRISEC